MLRYFEATKICGGNGGVSEGARRSLRRVGNEKTGTHLGVVNSGEGGCEAMPRVAESAPSCEVPTGNDGAVIRTAFALCARRSPRRVRNEKTGTHLGVPVFSLVTRSGIEPLLQP